MLNKSKTKVKAVDLIQVKYNIFLRSTENDFNISN